MPQLKISLMPEFVLTNEDFEKIGQFFKNFGNKSNASLTAKDFDKSMGKCSRKEAEGIVTILYKKYFDRNPDNEGLNTYAPYIENFGFLGIAWITYHFVQSEEMNEKVERELKEIYSKHLFRDPDESGKISYDKWIRFFGDTGKKFVETDVLNSTEYKSKH